jgi:hypothetical protein
MIQLLNALDMGEPIVIYMNIRRLALNRPVHCHVDFNNAVLKSKFRPSLGLELLANSDGGLYPGGYPVAPRGLP